MSGFYETHPAAYAVIEAARNYERSAESLSDLITVELHAHIAAVAELGTDLLVAAFDYPNKETPE